MELTPAESPREYTPLFCGEYISTLHMNNSSTLDWGKCFSNLPPLFLTSPWPSGDIASLPQGGHFFKVKTLTFTNRGGPWPRLLLTTCVSPYGKDAFIYATNCLGGTLKGFTCFLCFFLIFYFPAVSQRVVEIGKEVWWHRLKLFIT